jgi:putative ABC transport system ATP-binding protein
MMRALPAIELRALSRTYRAGPIEVGAIVDVSLEVRRGEAVAITGPSGSGKTTLLNLIAGLDLPTSGSVTVLSEPMSTASDRQRTALRARLMGLVFQEPHLLPGLSALDNVIAVRLPWEPRRALEPRARALLASLGLADRVDFPPRRLSGGERQRVALARALLGSPPLLLADEPTGNLDADRTTEFMEYLDRLKEETDLTIVLVTHDPAVAAVADRVLHLDRGRFGGEERLDQRPPSEVHVLEAD